MHLATGFKAVLLMMGTDRTDITRIVLCNLGLIHDRHKHGLLNSGQASARGFSGSEKRAAVDDCAHGFQVHARGA